MTASAWNAILTAAELDAHYALCDSGRPPEEISPREALR